MHHRQSLSVASLSSTCLYVHLWCDLSVDLRLSLLGLSLLKELQDWERWRIIPDEVQDLLREHELLQLGKALLVQEERPASPQICRGTRAAYEDDAFAASFPAKLTSLHDESRISRGARKTWRIERAG